MFRLGYNEPIMPKASGSKLFRRVKMKASTRKTKAKNKARRKGVAKIKTS